jgi:hypothetical protein
MLRKLGLLHRCQLLPKVVALIRVGLQGKCVLSLIDHYGYEIGNISVEMS